MAFLPFLHQAIGRRSLSGAEAAQAMTLILSGEVSTARIAAFLVALKMKGETVDEIAGFARAMRRHAIPVVPGELGVPLVDTAGTGGSEGPATFNISTVAAFVIAGAGVAVAKHGNRSISSQCGSADVMETLGVRLELDAQAIANCIRQAGIGFLFAPALHPAMKYAQPARVELKTRTAFNLLGPLTNPAGARIQLIGAPSLAAAGLMAQALSRLEVEHALVVHAEDGLDEISISGPTHALEVRPGSVTPLHLKPRDFGLNAASASELAGGDKHANAAIARAILAGEPGPKRDVVVANAAAALWLAGRGATFSEAARLAEHALDSGAALAKLQALITAAAEALKPTPEEK
jgi:anthranilate phosphoribosyltransferase